MSLKKQFDELKAEEKRQQELQRRKERQEAEEAAAFEARREIQYKANKRLVEKAFEEIDPENYLREIRDDFWKLGEITVGPIKREKDDSVKAVCEAQLTASWDVFIEEGIHEWTDFGERLSEVIPAHIEKHEVFIAIEIKGDDDSVYVQVGSHFGWYEDILYQGPQDKKEIEARLVSYCKEDEDRLPYTKEKAEAAREIRNYRLRHPFTKL